MRHRHPALRSARGIALAVVVAGSVSLASCGGTSETAAPTEPTEARTVAVAAPPTGPAILTVTGAITAANVGAELVFDLASLDELGVVAGEVFEPWTQTTLGYQGVRLHDVLEMAGVASDATVMLVALDDYAVTLPMGDIDDSVILATHASDGSAIAVEAGGPARLVFSDPGNPLSDADNWVWSVATVTVT